MIEAAQALVQRHSLLAPMVGHVGDGNFHMLLLVDPSSDAEMGAAAACVDEMVAAAQNMGGTCTGMRCGDHPHKHHFPHHNALIILATKTGEHGVGYGKLRYLEAERGAVAMDVMAAIKRALDPCNLLNPGKLGSC